MDKRNALLEQFGARAVLWAPSLWLVVFFLIPFVIVLKISLSQTAISVPPYVPVLDPTQGWDGIKRFFSGLRLDNFTTLISYDIYWRCYLKGLPVPAEPVAIPVA